MKGEMEEQEAQMVPESGGSIQIILHSLRAGRSCGSRETFAAIKSYILKSTINDYFSQSRAASCLLYLCVCVRVCQALQPLGLLRNAFEVDHNEALYLPSSPGGDLQTGAGRAGEERKSTKKCILTS